MGNSTIKLKNVCDVLAAKGIADPRGGPSGYGDSLGIALANQVMADLICERFNWKWNSANATPFYTNSWQQDYPQPAQPNGTIGWGENCSMVDINNTTMPKPLWNLSWRRALLPTTVSVWKPSNICWMYNSNLNLGVWPGAGVTFYPLVTQTPYPQNPIMSMRDANGNILIVTGFGVTGATAPVLPENSAEGKTVTDGTVTWTCVAGTSQGFRIDSLPNATGPTYMIVPVYQIKPPMFELYSQTLDPIPDDFSRFFFRGLESEWLIASPNPGDLKRGQEAKADWLNALMQAMKQGDRETDIFGLVPASNVVERGWNNWGPYTADNPY